MPGEALARMRGIPHIPSIIEINVRSGPSTNHDIVFKVPVGMSGLSILEVRPDDAGAEKDGKQYQWFKLQFLGGAVGWVRDDLIEVQGDLSNFGYGDLDDVSFAFALTRFGSAETPATTPSAPAEPAVPTTPSTPPDAVTEPPPVTVGQVWTPPGETTEPVMAPVLAAGDFPDAFADQDRVRRAAYPITAAWEGGFSAINTYDAGIVSFGFLQFTLAAGSLLTVVNKYLERSQSEQAEALRKYQGRVNARDSMLRTDNGFLAALRASAEDPLMIEAQYEVATTGYWQRVIDGYIVARQLKYPLTWALLFDMGVNFGVNHGFVRLAEKDLGVPSRSNPRETGLGEEQLITYVAQLRKRSHYRQAEKTGFVGLKYRADFWMGLVTSGDWYLRGDASGNVYPNGRTINVLNP